LKAPFITHGRSKCCFTATFLLESDGKVLAIAADDVYRLRGEPAPNTEAIKVLGIRLPFGGGSQFQPVLADAALDFHDPIAAAADPHEPRLVIVAANEVFLLTRAEDGKYAVAARQTLSGDENDGSAVAIAGQFVLVAREDGKLWLLHGNDLSVAKELSPEKHTQPRFAAASLDGNWFAVLFQNHNLWLIDGKTGAIRRAPVSGQGDISGFAFTTDRLLVADQVNRVTEYGLADFAREKSMRPGMTRSEMAYYYATARHQWVCIRRCHASGCVRLHRAVGILTPAKNAKAPAEWGRGLLWIQPSWLVVVDRRRDRHRYRPIVNEKPRPPTVTPLEGRV
jgi:hypothetical protein